MLPLFLLEYIEVILITAIFLLYNKVSFLSKVISTNWYVCYFVYTLFTLGISYLLLCINSETFFNSKTNWYVQWVINLVKHTNRFLLNLSSTNNLYFLNEILTLFITVLTPITIKIINCLFNIVSLKKYFNKDHKNYIKTSDSLKLLIIKLKKYLKNCWDSSYLKHCLTIIVNTPAAAYIIPYSIISFLLISLFSFVWIKNSFGGSIYNEQGDIIWQKITLYIFWVNANILFLFINFGWYKGWVLLMLMIWINYNFIFPLHYLFNTKFEVVVAVLVCACQATWLLIWLTRLIIYAYMFIYKLVLRVVLWFSYDRLYTDTKNLLNRWFKLTNILTVMFFLFLSLKLIQLIRFVWLQTLNLLFYTVYFYFIIKNLYYDADNVDSISIIWNLRNFIKTSFKSLYRESRIKTMKSISLSIYYNNLVTLLKAGTSVIKGVKFCTNLFIFLIYIIIRTLLVLFQVLKLSTLTLIVFFLNTILVGRFLVYVSWLYTPLVWVTMLWLKIERVVRNGLNIFAIFTLYSINIIYNLLCKLLIHFIYNFFIKNLIVTFIYAVLFMFRILLDIYMFFFRIMKDFFYILKLFLLKLMKLLLKIVMVILHTNIIMTKLLVPTRLIFLILIKTYLRLLKQSTLYLIELLTIRLFFFMQKLLYTVILIFLNFGSFVILFYNRKDKKLNLFKNFFMKMMMGLKKLNLIRKRRMLICKTNNKNQTLIRQMAKKRSALMIKVFKEDEALAIKLVRENRILTNKIRNRNLRLFFEKLAVLVIKISILRWLSYIVYNFLYFSCIIKNFLGYPNLFFLPATKQLSNLIEHWRFNWRFKILYRVIPIKLITSTLNILVAFVKLCKLRSSTMLFFLILNLNVLFQCLIKIRICTIQHTKYISDISSGFFLIKNHIIRGFSYYLHLYILFNLFEVFNSINLNINCIKSHLAYHYNMVLLAKAKLSTRAVDFTFMWIFIVIRSYCLLFYWSYNIWILKTKDFNIKTINSNTWAYLKYSFYTIICQLIYFTKIFCHYFRRSVYYFEYRFATRLLYDYSMFCYNVYRIKLFCKLLLLRVMWFFICIFTRILTFWLRLFFNFFLTFIFFILRILSTPIFIINIFGYDRLLDHLNTLSITVIVIIFTTYVIFKWRIQNSSYVLFKKIMCITSILAAYLSKLSFRFISFTFTVTYMLLKLTRLLVLYIFIPNGLALLLLSLKFFIFLSKKLYLTSKILDSYLREHNIKLIDRLNFYFIQKFKFKFKFEYTYSLWVMYYFLVNSSTYNKLYSSKIYLFMFERLYSFLLKHKFQHYLNLILEIHWRPIFFSYMIYIKAKSKVSILFLLQNFNKSSFINLYTTLNTKHALSSFYKNILWIHPINPLPTLLTLFNLVSILVNSWLLKLQLLMCLVNVFWVLKKTIYRFIYKIFINLYLLNLDSFLKYCWFSNGIRGFIVRVIKTLIGFKMTGLSTRVYYSVFTVFRPLKLHALVFNSLRVEAFELINLIKLIFLCKIILVFFSFLVTVCLLTLPVTLPIIKIIFYSVEILIRYFFKLTFFLVVNSTLIIFNKYIMLVLICLLLRKLFIIFKSLEFNNQVVYEIYFYIYCLESLFTIVIMIVVYCSHFILKIFLFLSKFIMLLILGTCLNFIYFVINISTKMQILKLLIFKLDIHNSFRQAFFKMNFFSKIKKLCLWDLYGIIYNCMPTLNMILDKINFQYYKLSFQFKKFIWYKFINSQPILYLKTIVSSMSIFIKQIERKVYLLFYPICFVLSSLKFLVSLPLQLCRLCHTYYCKTNTQLQLYFAVIYLYLEPRPITSIINNYISYTKYSLAWFWHPTKQLIMHLVRKLFKQFSGYLNLTITTTLTVLTLFDWLIVYIAIIIIPILWNFLIGKFLKHDNRLSNIFQFFFKFFRKITILDCIFTVRVLRCKLIQQLVTIIRSKDNSSFNYLLFLLSFLNRLDIYYITYYKFYYTLFYSYNFYFKKHDIFFILYRSNTDIRYIYYKVKVFIKLSAGLTLGIMFDRKFQTIYNWHPIREFLTIYYPLKYNFSKRLLRPKLDSILYAKRLRFLWLRFFFRKNIRSFSNKFILSKNSLLYFFYLNISKVLTLLTLFIFYLEAVCGWLYLIVLLILIRPLIIWKKITDIALVFLQDITYSTKRLTYYFLNKLLHVTYKLLNNILRFFLNLLFYNLTIFTGIFFSYIISKILKAMNYCLLMCNKWYQLFNFFMKKLKLFLHIYVKAISTISCTLHSKIWFITYFYLWVSTPLTPIWINLIKVHVNSFWNLYTVFVIQVKPLSTILIFLKIIVNANYYKFLTLNILHFLRLIKLSVLYILSVTSIFLSLFFSNITSTLYHTYFILPKLIKKPILFATYLCFISFYLCIFNFGMVIHYTIAISTSLIYLFLSFFKKITFHFMHIMSLWLCLFIIFLFNIEFSVVCSSLNKIQTSPKDIWITLVHHILSFFIKKLENLILNISKLVVYAVTTFSEFLFIKQNIYFKVLTLYTELVVYKFYKLITNTLYNKICLLSIEINNWSLSTLLNLWTSIKIITFYVTTANLVCLINYLWVKSFTFIPDSLKILFIVFALITRTYAINNLHYINQITINFLKSFFSYKSLKIITNWENFKKSKFFLASFIHVYLLHKLSLFFISYFYFYCTLVNFLLFKGIGLLNVRFIQCTQHIYNFFSCNYSKNINFIDILNVCKFKIYILKVCGFFKIKIKTKKTFILLNRPDLFPIVSNSSKKIWFIYYSMLNIFLKITELFFVCYTAKLLPYFFQEFEFRLHVSNISPDSIANIVTLCISVLFYKFFFSLCVDSKALQLLWYFIYLTFFINMLWFIYLLYNFGHLNIVVTFIIAPFLIYLKKRLSIYKID